jgi:hypothetical protein
MEITDYIELTKNFRQEASQVLGDCLGRCRTNVETIADLALLNSRFIPDAEQALKEMQNKRHAICLASTRKAVHDINTKFHNSLVAQGNRSVNWFALHRESQAQRTSRAVARSTDDVKIEQHDFVSSTLIDNSTRLDSGLNATQRSLCLNYDIDGRKGKVNASVIKLSIGSRVMLLKNIDPLRGLVNGTTGTVVGFVYSTVESANPICERPDVSTAARIEPQLPVVLVRVDEEFWKAPDYNFTISPPLDKSGNWDRVIAIPPIESRTSFIMKFQSGQKHIKRIQLLLILAFALTVHKAQGLTKEYVLFLASSKLFARALAYVALSRFHLRAYTLLVGK